MVGLSESVKCPLIVIVCCSRKWISYLLWSIFDPPFFTVSVGFNVLVIGDAAANNNTLQFKNSLRYIRIDVDCVHIRSSL